MIINYEKSEMKSIVWYIEICREQYEVDFRVDEHSVVHKFANSQDVTISIYSGRTLKITINQKLLLLKKKKKKFKKLKFNITNTINSFHSSIITKKRLPRSIVDLQIYIT